MGSRLSVLLCGLGFCCCGRAAVNARPGPQTTVLTVRCCGYPPPPGAQTYAHTHTHKHIHVHMHAQTHTPHFRSCLFCGPPPCPAVQVGQLPDPRAARPGLGVAALHRALMRLQRPGLDGLVSIVGEPPPSSQQQSPQQQSPQQQQQLLQQMTVERTWTRLLGALRHSDFSEVLTRLTVTAGHADGNGGGGGDGPVAVRSTLWLPAAGLSGRDTLLCHIVLVAPSPPRDDWGFEVCVEVDAASVADGGTAASSSPKLGARRDEGGLQLTSGGALRVVQLCKLASVPPYLLADVVTAEVAAVYRAPHQHDVLANLAATGVCLVVQALSSRPDFSDLGSHAHQSGSARRPTESVAAPALPYFLIHGRDDRKLVLQAFRAVLDASIVSVSEVPQRNGCCAAEEVPMN